MNATTKTPVRTPVKLNIIRVPQGVSSPALVLNAVEGFGKTTTGAQAPTPIILMARGEAGFRTLRQRSLVPDVDAVECNTWQETLDTVSALEQSQHQTIVLDALGGFERLCHEHVCTTQFGGDWGEKGFGGFQRGYEMSVAQWLQLLQRLDLVRKARPCNILMLSHAKVTNFKNPLGPDFDRYAADCHHKTWASTSRWADAVLFGTFVTVVSDKKGSRAKGIGGSERVIYTNRTDGYDAKNRYGMPETLAIGGPETMWTTIWGAITGVSGVAAAGAEEIPV
jgi:hypothetical protein